MKWKVKLVVLGDKEGVEYHQPWRILPMAVYRMAKRLGVKVLIRRPLRR